MLRAVALSFAIVGHRTERLGARQKLEMLRAVALSSAIVGHRTERLRAPQKLKMLRAVALSFAIVGHRTERLGAPPGPLWVVFSSKLIIFGPSSALWPPHLRL